MQWKKTAWHENEQIENFSFPPAKYTGHTQKNGAVLIVFTITTAPFFCVCPVYKKKLGLYSSEVFVNGKGSIWFLTAIAFFLCLLKRENNSCAQKRSSAVGKKLLKFFVQHTGPRLLLQEDRLHQTPVCVYMLHYGEQRKLPPFSFFFKDLNETGNVRIT
jgi:hypothetical protein